MTNVFDCVFLACWLTIYIDLSTWSFLDVGYISHSSYAFAFTELLIMNMLTAGTLGPYREILQRIILSFLDAGYI